jgi:hypothetical protein
MNHRQAYFLNLVLVEISSHELVEVLCRAKGLLDSPSTRFLLTIEVHSENFNEHKLT